MQGFAQTAMAETAARLDRVRLLWWLLQGSPQPHGKITDTGAEKQHLHEGVTVFCVSNIADAGA